MTELNCIFQSWPSVYSSAVWPGHFPIKRRSQGAPPGNWPKRPALPLECSKRGKWYSWLGVLKCLPLGCPLRIQPCYEKPKPPREATCRCSSSQLPLRTDFESSQARCWMWEGRSLHTMALSWASPPALLVLSAGRQHGAEKSPGFSALNFWSTESMRRIK